MRIAEQKNGKTEKGKPLPLGGHFMQGISLGIRGINHVLRETRKHAKTLNSTTKGRWCKEGKQKTKKKSIF